jgi:alpha-mannosidase
MMAYDSQGISVQATHAKIKMRIQELFPFRWRGRRIAIHWQVSHDIDALPFTTLTAGHPYGKPNQHYWWRTHIPNLPGEQPVLRVVLDEGTSGGSEALVYVNDQIMQGLDSHHSEVLLNGSGPWNVALNVWTGWREGARTLAESAILLQDPVGDRLYWMLSVAETALTQLDASNPDYYWFLQGLDQAVRYIDWRDPGSDEFYQSLATARDYWYRYRNQRGQHKQPITVHAVGHAHIDVAWLWQTIHTKGKAIRTFANQLQLLQQYPQYRFAQSQPQLYAWVKENAPELWQNIQRMVAGGQWEPLGALWVEADCNLPSGESLVRQILYGTQFFETEFGYQTLVAWLPDTFGFTAALPQILSRSGIKYFVTSKLSWNQFNSFPFDTFLWRGLDGSEVLAYFLTMPSLVIPPMHSTYNGRLTADAIWDTWRLYEPKEGTSDLLAAFGWGDGGGGPTRDMIEMGEQLNGLPVVPQINFGTVRNFFEILESRRQEGWKVPIWQGDLYLEFHRGTFTSQGRTKKANRDMEHLLHNAEFLLVRGWLELGLPYPKNQLETAWKTLLRNQFHDILPGSAAPEVYRDTTVEYKETRKMIDELLRTEDPHSIELSNPVRYQITNTLSCERSEVIFIPWRGSEDITIARAGYGIIPSQRVTQQDGTAGILTFVENIPSFGGVAIELSEVNTQESYASHNLLRVDQTRIESASLVIQLNEYGAIDSVFDKRVQREIIPNGKVANRFRVFEDKPLRNDAWEIEPFYEEKFWDVTERIRCKVIESGPLRGIVEQQWKYRNSLITQRIIVYAHETRIDFETLVDWHEHQQLLKVEFPVDIQSAWVRSDIQFGNVMRPVHRNTSWEWAHFESLMHTWVVLAEADYGVALLNNGKYGYDVQPEHLRLTLIKSGIYPDPTADQGLHQFTYAFMPYQGDFLKGSVHRVAQRLNSPCAVWPTIRACDTPSLLSVDAPNVWIDTIKMGEKVSGLVVRLYEYGGMRRICTVYAGFAFRDVTEVNLMEKELLTGSLEKLDHSTFRFVIKPYEIRTFLITVPEERE